MRIAVLLAAGSETVENLSIFDPASPATAAIVNLAILVLAIVGLIFAVVEGILFFSARRFRRADDEPAAEPPQVYGSHPIEIAWTAAPAIIVFFLLLITARTLWEGNAAPPARRAGDDVLAVTVTGRQWWWEYRYEDEGGRQLGLVTANELHIPLSEPGAPRRVRLTLESADVCHSFWVPRLAGKVDLIPGHPNELWLEALQSGLFVGQCAEYCGAQHANMLLRVVVDEPTEFQRWLEHQQQPAAELAEARAGRETFLAESCVNCHRVRGTAADGDYAPDLTHLMSRQTLASGMTPNTPENLAHWVRDPQSIKPGCLMPAFGLDEETRAKIVGYLLTLD